MRAQLSLACILGCVVAAFAAASDSFRAATVQYVPVDATGTPQETMMQNMANYRTHTLQAAKSGAQIVVFPEFGLLDADATSKCSTPSDMAAWCEPVPAPASPGAAPVNPCEQKSSFAASPVVVAASCMARNASIITAVNLCQFVKGTGGASDKYFNTELVLSETGEVLAAYKKSHVWFKKCFDEPTTPDLVTFNASFGVQFGIFTCFDIMFSTPGPALADEGVKHFLTSAAIPLVGATADKVWSWRYGSALIASDLETGQSGVWSKGTRLSADAPKSGAAIVTADVPISV